MIQLLRLIPGLEADVDAELFEEVLVHVGEDDRGVGLGALELGKLVDGEVRHGVCDRADGQRDQ